MDWVLFLLGVAVGALCMYLGLVIYVTWRDERAARG
jgi:hypothetical protein